MEENMNAEVNTNESVGIAGTPFKTPEELAKGYLELNSKIDSMGNELGNAKKAAETATAQSQQLAQILERVSQTKPAEEPKGTDFKMMKNEIKTKLSSLDPMDADYSKIHADLLSKLTDISDAEADDKINKVIKVAAKTSQDEVAKYQSKMDAKAQQDRFLQQNPTFNEPETQAKIKDFIAQDKTGVHDAISAFFQIQRDELAGQTKQLSELNAEMQKRLDLTKGTEQTGRVIVKGQSPGQQQTNAPQPTGKDVEAGMMAALKASRGE